MHQAFRDGFEKSASTIDNLIQLDIKRKLLASIGAKNTVAAEASKDINGLRKELSQRITDAQPKDIKKVAESNAELLRYAIPTAVGVLGGAAIGAAASPEDRRRGARRGAIIGGVTGAARPTVQQIRSHLMKKYPEQTKAMLSKYSPEMGGASMTAGPELAAAGAGALAAAATN
jgi:hypothetical protein